MNAGPGLFVLVIAVPLVVGGWAVVDAVREPRWAWDAAGRSKRAWVALLVAGTTIGFFMCAGFGTALAYTGVVKPKLREVREKGPWPPPQ